MTTTNPLFGAADLNALPDISGVTDEEAAAIERVVWGWLKPLLETQGITERPAEPSDELWAWALELGAIYRSNPDSLKAYSLESESSTYDSERRDQLLRNVATGGATPPGAVPAPQGCFPPAHRYPDPARGYGSPSTFGW